MAHDRISESARWRNCVHEAGHVALALLTQTPVIRAAAYRHYSSASRAGGSHGYARHEPARSTTEKVLISWAGGCAEQLFTDRPSWAVMAGCGSDFTDIAIASADFSTEMLERCFDVCETLLSENRIGVLQVAEVIHDARGYVPGRILEQAFAK